MLDWVFPLATLIGAIISGEFALGVWINSRFEAMRKESAAMRDSIFSQLQYHERHDDRRFAEITNALWEIRLQSALKGTNFDHKEAEPRAPRAEDTSRE